MKIQNRYNAISLFRKERQNYRITELQTWVKL